MCFNRINYYNLSVSPEYRQELTTQNESYGNDIQLLQTAIGSYSVPNMPTWTITNMNSSSYWVAARGYVYGSGANPRHMEYGVNPSGNLILYWDLHDNSGNWGERASVRPILSLKPTAKAAPSGDGSANNPWVLVE